MRFLCLSLFLLVPAFSNAQDGRRVSCRFVCFEGAVPPPQMVNVFDKGIETPCIVPANSFSDPTVCFAKGTSITFLSTADHKPVATASVPLEVRAAILVFIPATKADSPLPWQVYALEDTVKNFPDGGAFVANLYKQDIKFIIGEHKVLLKSGKSHGFARPTQRDDFNMSPVIFQFQQDDSWRTANESLLRFVPGMRYLILAYIDPASGRPRISTYQDIMPIPVTPVKPGQPGRPSQPPPSR